MAPKSRRSQPNDVTPEEISNVLFQHAPNDCKKKAAQNGKLFEFTPQRQGGVVDRTNIQKGKVSIAELLKLNSSGIFNASTIQSGLELYNEEMGGVMTSEEHTCMQSQEFPGQHLWLQSNILKKYFAGLSRIKSNSSSGTKHPYWLTNLLDLLQGPGDTQHSDSVDQPTEPEQSRASNTQEA